MTGKLAVDTVYLTDTLTVTNQTFAQIQHISEEKDDECPGWDGKLGLGPTKEGIDEDNNNDSGGNSNSNFGGANAQIVTLRANLESLLQYPMFSLYLADIDDYPPADEASLIEPPTSASASVRPTQASSELVFGGIQSAHYTGCLKWHKLVQYTVTKPGVQHEYLFWNLKLQAARVGGTIKQVLPESNVALIISESTLSLGNTVAVAKFAEVNNMKCIQIRTDPEFTNGEGAIIRSVPCDGGVEFFTAYTTCDAAVQPLELVVDGVTYTLGKDVLLEKATVETLGPDIVAQYPGKDLCVLTLVPVPDVPGWMLGEGFLREYYAVFDFGQYRIGLAPREAADDGDVCPADAHLDIANQQQQQASVSSNAPAPPTGGSNETTTTTSAPSLSPSPTTTNENGSSNNNQTGTDNNNSTRAPSSPLSPPSMPTNNTPPSEPSSSTTTQAPATPPAPPFAAAPTPAPAVPATGRPHQTPPKHPTHPTNTSPHQNKPVSSTYRPPPESDSSSSSSSPATVAVPVVIAGVVVLGGLILWRRRRARYERAAYFDDMAYRMGDMELREMY